MIDYRKTVTIELNSGNTLELSFNEESQLLVLDLQSGKYLGGNEIYRGIIDQEKLLDFSGFLMERREGKQ